MSINLNYVAWKNRRFSKSEVKEIYIVCKAFFHLKNLKFTCLEILLSLFRL